MSTAARALAALLAAIEPRPSDLIVTLGDYVNRGPDSRGVLERLIALERECTLVPLLGNLVCIDTYCYGGGWPTALEVHTEEVWQADRHGELRPSRFL
jgi:hypothetical protein